MVTSRRRPTGTGSGRRTTAGRTTTRRTTGSSYGYRRRRTPRTSTTLGSAFALAVIALFTRASWPVRIGLVVLVLVVVAGYLVIRARHGNDDPAAADIAAADIAAADPAAAATAAADPAAADTAAGNLLTDAGPGTPATSASTDPPADPKDPTP